MKENLKIAAIAAVVVLVLPAVVTAIKTALAKPKPAA